MIGPQRIACLSSETVEVLYALGQEHRIAGITAFARHPAGVTKKHPIISGFSTAKAEKVFAAAPDLILGSWCGQKFETEVVKARADWRIIPAVQHNQVHEIASEDLLVPGITAITRGLPLIQSYIRSFQ